MSQVCRSNVSQHVKSSFAVFVGKQAQTPFFAGQSQSHKFKGFKICVIVEYVTLRHVTNLWVATFGRCIEYLNRAPDGLLQTKEQTK
jgi:hypothetical protein